MLQEVKDVEILLFQFSKHFVLIFSGYQTIQEGKFTLQSDCWLGKFSLRLLYLSLRSLSFHLFRLRKILYLTKNIFLLAG